MKLVFRDLQVPLTEFTLHLESVLEGQITAITGASGAGKTTLLDCIAGLRVPHAGAITVDGRTLVDVDAGVAIPSRARGVGYVPQDRALFPHLTARSNVLYGANRATGAEARGLFTLSHAVEVLEIGTLLDRSITALSGGERQRVALARALLSRPRLLLLDEPLAGLDARLQERTQALLRRVHVEFGVPMLYVSHAPEEIAALCDDVLVLDRGRVLAHGAPESVFERTDLPTLRLRG